MPMSSVSRYQHWKLNESPAIAGPTPPSGMLVTLGLKLTAPVAPVEDRGFKGTFCGSNRQGNIL